MISLSSGLLQFASNAYLVTPDSTGTSAPADNGLKQLSVLADSLQNRSKSQASSTSSSSAQLAQDTYTPSGQSQTVQVFGAFGKISSSSVGSATASTQGNQGNSVALASLIQNQTISGSLDMRQILEDAIEPYENASAIKSAWDAIGMAVSTGDYSGAQSALADYTVGLAAAHASLADNSPVAALESALQTGNQSDVQAAYAAFSGNTPEVPMFVQGLGYSGDAQTYAAVGAMVEPGLAVDLQKLGYTETNATAEANAIIMGIMVDDATVQSTLQVATLGTTAQVASNFSQVDQSIADLAKAAAQSTDKNTLSNIIVGMSQANTVSAMEATLTQLASEYSRGARDSGADNASQATAGASS